MPGNYESAYFEPIYLIEDRHFWFQSRNRLIAQVLTQRKDTYDSSKRILEVGCGTGNVLRVLEQVYPEGEVFGLDLFLDGLQYARKRTTCPLLQADISHLPFKGVFDLVGIFDVLEHQEDDLYALGCLHSILKKGGQLILTVPAAPSLWSYFDEASGHYRRYDIEDLIQKLQRTGFEIENQTHFMALIYPITWLFRKLSMAGCSFRRSDNGRNHDLSMRELRVVPGFNEVMAWLLNQEHRFVSTRGNLPFGTSILVIARKI